MNILNRITLDKEVEHILTSKYNYIFLEYLNKFCEVKLTEEDVKNSSSPQGSFKTNNKWMQLYENITHKSIKDVPSLAFKYCFKRAELIHKSVKRFASKFNVPIIEVAREYRKLCYKYTNEHRPKVNEIEQETPVFRRDSKFSFLTQINPVRRYTLRGNQLTNVTKHDSQKKLNKLHHSELKDEEEQFEAEKKHVSHLEQLKKANKLNIFLGEFQTYNNKNASEIEKINIYDGSLCASYFLNYTKEKKNYEYGENMDVKQILKKEGGMFIPNDFKKQKQQEYILGKISEEKNNSHSLRKAMQNTSKKLLHFLLRSLSEKKLIKNKSDLSSQGSSSNRVLPPKVSTSRNVEKSDSIKLKDLSNIEKTFMTRTLDSQKKTFRSLSKSEVFVPKKNIIKKKIVIKTSKEKDKSNDKNKSKEKDNTKATLVDYLMKTSSDNNNINSNNNNTNIKSLMRTQFTDLEMLYTNSNNTITNSIIGNIKLNGQKSLRKKSKSKSKNSININFMNFLEKSDFYFTSK